MRHNDDPRRKEHRTPGAADTDSSILGHKLNNLLTPVVGMACILSTKAAASGDRDAQRRADTIRDTARAASRLLSMFFLVRDIEAGVYVPHRRSADLDLLLESVVRDVAGEIRDTGVRVDLAAARPCRIMIDCELLPPVFNNLIAGAVHHVAAQPDETQRVVTVGLRMRADDAVVTIHYASTPLDPVSVQSFFAPFGSTAVGGEARTGLEYSHARAVVEAHGGRVSVASPASGGVTVTVVLPAGRRPEREPERDETGER